MLGINGFELILLITVAVLVPGPERLPEYAAQLARLTRNLRAMSLGAREQLRDELGPDLADVDWSKLDPRQYNPRTIITNALLSEEPDLQGPRSKQRSSLTTSN